MIYIMLDVCSYSCWASSLSFPYPSAILTTDPASSVRSQSSQGEVRRCPSSSLFLCFSYRPFILTPVISFTLSGSLLFENASFTIVVLLLLISLLQCSCVVDYSWFISKLYLCRYLFLYEGVVESRHRILLLCAAWCVSGSKWLSKTIRVPFHLCPLSNTSLH